MADIDLAKSLFGSASAEAGSTTILFGVALGDSEEGEVLVRIDDELTAPEGGEEDYDGLEVDVENEEDGVLDVGEDEDEDAFGEDDEQYDEGEEVEEEDQDSDYDEAEAGVE